MSGAHKYGGSAVNGSAISLKAGTDMDCGDWGAHAYLKELPAALKAGLVTEADLDKALLRLTRLQVDSLLLSGLAPGRCSSPCPPASYVLACCPNHGSTSAYSCSSFLHKDCSCKP